MHKNVSQLHLSICACESVTVSKREYPATLSGISCGVDAGMRAVLANKVPPLVSIRLPLSVALIVPATSGGRITCPQQPQCQIYVSTPVRATHSRERSYSAVWLYI